MNFNPTTPDEILDEYENDIKLSPHLGKTLQELSFLHAKYQRIHSLHLIKYKALHGKFKELKKNKWLWISGKISRELLKTLGWVPFEMKLLKNQYDIFINADIEVLALEQAMGYHEEMARVCDSLIWDIKDRNKSLQAAVSYERFLAGN